MSKAKTPALTPADRAARRFWLTNTFTVRKGCWQKLVAGNWSKVSDTDLAKYLRGAYLADLEAAETEVQKHLKLFKASQASLSKAQKAVDTARANLSTAMEARTRIVPRSPEIPAPAPRPAVARLKVHPDLWLYRLGTNSRQVAQATTFGQLMKAWLGINKSGCSELCTSTYGNGSYRFKFWQVQTAFKAHVEATAEELASNLKTFMTPWQGSVEVVKSSLFSGASYSVVCVLPTKPQVVDLEAMRETMLLLCSRMGDRVPEAKLGAAQAKAIAAPSN